MKTTIKNLGQLVLFILPMCVIQAQISGNQIYGNSNRNATIVHKAQSTTINNGSLSVSVSILMNSKADGFMMTLGLNEEATTVKECNQLINKRIDGFLSKIKSLGIKKDACYVDFIAQTKVYDFAVEGETMEQFEKGFEIKKNIIVTTNLINDLEKVITMASEFEIYDIIKVEYFKENSGEIQDELFQKALQMAEVKRLKYLTAFGKKTIGTPDAVENFEVYYPKNQYKTYQAYESAEIETYHTTNRNANYLKKLARKNKSFYYDGVSTAGFDKVINSEQTEVGIQYALTLTVTYKIDTSI